MVLRRHANLSRTINLPAAGLWRLTYEVGSRPTGAYSLDLSTDVQVDGVTVFTHPAITTHGEKHPFQRVETPVVELAAGEHTLTLVQSDSTNGSGSQNYDYFVFERLEESTQFAGFSKSGDGRLTLDNWETDAPVTVQGGSLMVEDSRLGGQVSVADGSTLELCADAFDPSSRIVVVDGARLRLCDMEDNILVNGNFEADGSYLNATAKGQITGWTFGKTKDTTLNANGSGLQGNKGNVSTDAPWTPESAGPVTAYLREDSTVSQTFTLDQDGTYTLGFLKACRGTLYSTTMPVKVMLDDSTEIFSCTSNSKDSYERFAVELQLTTGQHTISFETGEPTTRESAGAMVFIDDVKLHRICEVPDFGACEVRLVAGSQLQLDNMKKVTIRNLFVDDVRISGGRKALEAAGVTVTGSGAIRVGDPQGLMMILK